LHPGGDSAALSSRCGLTADAERIWFPPASTQLHAGSRGEYANETHFVTDSDWSQHLNVLRLPADHDVVLLMTDGAMDVAIVRGEVFPHFLPVVAEQLLKTGQRAEREAMLETWLADPLTHRVTGDDKTLLLILRGGEVLEPQLSLDLAKTKPPPLPELPPPLPPSPLPLPLPLPTAVVPPKPQPLKPVQAKPARRPTNLLPDWRWWAVLIAALCLLIGPLAFVAADKALQVLKTPEPPAKPGPKAAVAARFEGGDKFSLGQGQSLRVRVLAARGSRVEVERLPADLELSASGRPCAQPVHRDSETDFCEFVVAADAEAPPGLRQLRLRVLDVESAREQQLVLNLLIRAVQPQ
jgi:Protein phosphatase 2C